MNTRRESIKQVMGAASRLIGFFFVTRVVTRSPLVHNAGPGPCTKCGCNGFAGSSYICSNSYCQHTWNDHSG